MAQEPHNGRLAGTVEASAPAGPSGRALLFARVVAWLTVILYVAGNFAHVWLKRRLGLQGGNSVEDVVLFVGFGMFVLMGALLVAKRPGNLVGWILTAVGLMVGLFPVGDAYAAYVMTTRGEPDALAVVGAWPQSWYWFLLLALVFIYLPLLFPDGRLPSRRWLPVALLAGVGTASTVVLGMLTDTLTGQEVDYRIENPIGVEGLAPLEELPVFGVLSALLAFVVVGAFASVVARFRRSRGIERQQLKWFLYAAAFILAVPVSDYVPEIVSGVLFGLVLVGLPGAIGIAVLRYRLYDIDLVINKTLVYGTLTATLAAIYFGSVVLLQTIFRALTGEGSQLVVVASTLAIAALFSPLRRRLQAFIDRRFYRQKYDARRTLEEFGAKLRDETDLESLNTEMMSVVRETVRPAHASLWLREPSGPAGRGST